MVFWAFIDNFSNFLFFQHVELTRIHMGQLCEAIAGPTKVEADILDESN